MIIKCYYYYYYAYWPLYSLVLLECWKKIGTNRFENASQFLVTFGMKTRSTWQCFPTLKPQMGRIYIYVFPPHLSFFFNDLFWEVKKNPGLFKVVLCCIWSWSFACLKGRAKLPLKWLLKPVYIHFPPMIFPKPQFITLHPLKLSNGLQREQEYLELDVSLSDFISSVPGVMPGIWISLVDHTGTMCTF